KHDQSILSIHHRRLWKNQDILYRIPDKYIDTHAIPVWNIPLSYLCPAYYHTLLIDYGADIGDPPFSGYYFHSMKYMLIMYRHYTLLHNTPLSLHCIYH